MLMKEMEAVTKKKPSHVMGWINIFKSPKYQKQFTDVVATFNKMPMAFFTKLEKKILEGI